MGEVPRCNSIPKSTSLCGGSLGSSSETEIGLSGLYHAVEERTVSSPILLLTGTVLS